MQLQYIVINGFDCSKYCCGLKVSNKKNWHAQTNAAGNTVIDVINNKRTVEAKFIPLDNQIMKNLLVSIASAEITLAFLNPLTDSIDVMYCTVQQDDVEYYSLRAKDVMFKPITLKFLEL